MSAGIAMEVDGKYVDLSELSWYLITRCGCARGVHLAFSDYGDGPPMTLVTSDQAEEAMWETKAERAQARRDGCTVRLDLTSRVRELLILDCPHRAGGE